MDCSYTETEGAGIERRPGSDVENFQADARDKQKKARTGWSAPLPPEGRGRKCLVQKSVTAVDPHVIRVERDRPVGLRRCCGLDYSLAVIEYARKLVLRTGNARQLRLDTDVGALVSVLDNVLVVRNDFWCAGRQTTIEDAHAIETRIVHSHIEGGPDRARERRFDRIRDGGGGSTQVDGRRAGRGICNGRGLGGSTVRLDCYGVGASVDDEIIATHSQPLSQRSCLCAAR